MKRRLLISPPAPGSLLGKDFFHLTNPGFRGAVRKMTRAHQVPWGASSAGAVAEVAGSERSGLR